MTSQTFTTGSTSGKVLEKIFPLHFHPEKYRQQYFLDISTRKSVGTKYFRTSDLPEMPAQIIPRLPDTGKASEKIFPLHFHLEKYQQQYFQYFSSQHTYLIILR